MNTFCALAVVNIHPGSVLLLSADQAARRVSSLDDLGDGLYLVKAPVQLKAGEVFGYDGDLNKAMAEQMIKVNEPVKTGRKRTK
jgi:ABC-type amino acid transport substrate-binding protein